MMCFFYCKMLYICITQPNCYILKRFITYLFILAPLFLLGQKRPKVGLVLSGGGAKGFAHVGVLKEIEKAGLQIDYIGGTSMGAIIGGLYAVGYSPEEIEQKLREIDYDKLIIDDVPRKDMPLFDKEHQEKYAITLPVTKNGVMLQGVSKGQNAHNYFTELFSIADGIDSFKKLPIPFYCIATDIVNGEKVVLESGSLARAVRASGAFPTLVHPVKINDRLLLDGGIVDNFPVDEMRKKGMNFIIGVDVQDKLLKKEDLHSVLDLLNQIISFQIYEKSNSQKKDVDIYLRPNIKGFKVMSFDKFETIIANGEKEAKKYKEVFERLAKRQRKRKIKKLDKNVNKYFLLDNVIITGNNRYTDDYILGTMQLKLCDSINYNTISQRVNRLTATKNFSNVEFFLENTNEGKRLKLFLDESENKSFLKLGVHYDKYYGLGVLTNFTYKHLLTNNDIFSFDFVLGDKIRYDLNYFIDNGFHLGMGIRSSYKAFDGNFNYINDKVNKINIEFSGLLNRVYAQSKFNKKYALTIGVDYRALKADSHTLLNKGKPITYEKTNYGVAFANIKIDDFNKPYYPTKGYYFNSTLDWVFYSDRNEKSDSFINKDLYNPFAQLHTTLSSVVTAFNKASLQLSGEVGWSLFNIPTDAFSYKIGGYNRNLPESFISFYGWNVADYMRNNFIKGEAELRVNFYKKHHLLATINAIKMGETNFMEDNPFENHHIGYSVGYGLETFVGPIELRYSWSPKNNGMLLFNLGFWF